MVATETAKSEKARRIQFEFSPEAYERLDEVKQATDAQSYAEVVRNALRVYDWMIKQQNKGYTIALSKEGEPLREVEFVFD